MNNLKYTNQTSKKPILKIVIAVIVLVLVSGVAYGVYISREKMQITQKPNVSGWKICTNNKYGFRIKYPRDWEDWPEPSFKCEGFYPKIWNNKPANWRRPSISIILATPGNLTPENALKHPNPAWGKYARNEIDFREFVKELTHWEAHYYASSNAQGEPTKNFSVKQINVGVQNNIPAFKVSIEEYDSSSVYFADDNKEIIYEFVVAYPKPIQEEEIKKLDDVSNQMLSAFQFID